MEDKKSLWKVAPKNTMNDSMYNLDYINLTEEQMNVRREQFEFCLKNDEVVFDAADFTRTGKHIFG